MKGILCFDTRYGSTEQVCKWIASGIKCGDTTIHNVNYKFISDYDYYIIGTPIFIGKPMQSVTDFIRLNNHKFIDKPLFLFITSWAQSTKYNEECYKFIDLLESYLHPNVTALTTSLPGKLLMDRISYKDRRTMERLLRRIDNMSDEFVANDVMFSDQRSKKLSIDFGRKINEILRNKSSLL